ncbi:MAG TPA: superoxide dismutase family protein [Myxococcota bacterium]
MKMPFDVADTLRQIAVRLHLTTALLLAVAVVGACKTAEPMPTPPDSPPTNTPGVVPDGDVQPQAKANLQSKSGSTVTGAVTFTRIADDKVVVVADVSGLSPGRHGFHIHQTGDCSAVDGSSAGDHFAISEGPHGLPDSPRRHTGDLGNLPADETGHARLEFTDSVISLDGERSVVGRAVIVHETVDDGQDVKSAGGRVACGVIEPL